MKKSLNELNVLEIGRPYVKHAIPNTRCFASTITACVHGTVFEPIGKLSAALHDPSVDLVVCHPPRQTPWSLDWWIRHIGHRNILKGYLPLTSLIAPQILRIDHKKPVAIVDLDDSHLIRSCDHYLWDRSVAWFKRELPLDRWRVFMRKSQDSYPTLRFRKQPRNRERIAKLYPIPLGHKIGIEADFPTSIQPKTSDVFWSGLTEGSSYVREQGLKQLNKLKALGYQIDVPESSLPRSEFFQRAANAYLVWSPEGYGWDCFRHYEAPMCWSVPLMNRPTIELHRPFIHNEHALYYDVQGDHLCETVVEALNDRDRLVSMAIQARQHVVDSHQLSAVTRYIVDTTLTRCESRNQSWV